MHLDLQAIFIGLLFDIVLYELFVCVSDKFSGYLYLQEFFPF